MAEENFLIQILLTAESQVGEVLDRVADGADKVTERFALADRAANRLGDRLDKVEGRARALQGSLNGVNTKLKTMVGGLEKTNVALESTVKSAQRLESRIDDLGEKVTRLGTKKASPKVDLDDGAAQGRLDELILKLASLEKRRRTVRIDVEERALDEQIARVEKKIKDVGGEDELIKFHAAIDQQSFALIDEKARNQTKTFAAEQDKQREIHRQKVQAFIADVEREAAAEQAFRRLAGTEAEKFDTEQEARRHASDDRRRAASRKVVDDFIADVRREVDADAALRRRAGDEATKFDVDRETKRQASVKRGLDRETQQRKDADREISRLLTRAHQVEAARPRGLAGIFDTSTKRDLDEIEARLRVLGARREHIKVVVDFDRSFLDRIDQGLQEFADDNSARISGLNRKFQDLQIFALAAFSEPLLSAVTALAGGLTAVASSAIEAGAALGGALVAGIAQALPVLGLLLVVTKQIADVIKVASLQTKASDKANQAGAAQDNARANSLRSLGDAHLAVTRAQQGLVDAQEKLNEARRQGERDLTDLILAERRATQQAEQSRLGLAFSLARGDAGQTIASQRLQATSDSIAAQRQRIDTQRGIAGGVGGLPSVQSAERGVQSARDSLRSANEQVDAATRGLDTAAAKIGSAEQTYQTALGKLSAGQRVLLKSVMAFKDLFTGPHSLVAEITDPLVVGFAKAIDAVIALAKDPEVRQAFTELSGALGDSLAQFVQFLTTGPVRDAFLEFTRDAAQNLVPLTHIIESLITIFASVAQAASGPLHIILLATAGFLQQISDYVSSPKGQTALADFFNNALVPLEAFVQLSGALVRLLATVIGLSASEGTRAVNDLTTQINNATQYLHDNADAVREFFHKAVDGLEQIGVLLFEIGKAIVDVFDPQTLKEFTDFIIVVVLPTLEGIVKGIGFILHILLQLYDALGPLGPLIIQTFAFLTAGRIGVAFFSRMIAGFVTIGLKVTALKSLLAGLFGLLEKGAAGAGLAKLAALFGGASTKFRKPPSGGPGGLLAQFESTAGGAAAGAGGVGASRTAIVRRLAAGGAAEGIGSGVLAAAAAVKAAQALSSILGGNRGGAQNALTSGLRSVLGPGTGGVLADKLFGPEQTDKAKKFTDQISKLGDTLNDLPAGKLLALAKEAERIAEAGGKGADKADKLAHALVQLAEDKKTSETIRRIRFSFTDLATGSKLDLDGMARQVQRNMRFIRSTMDTESQQGKEAISANYAAAADAIRIQMRRAGKVTKEGLAAIRQDMIHSLTTWGLSGHQAEAYLHIRNNAGAFERDTSTGPATAGKARGGFAGWVGNMGERGRDLVHALVGRGEAILNYSQQSIVDPALALAKGMGVSPYGNLSELFSGVRTPHYMASGGYAGGADFNGHPSNVSTAIRSLIGLMERRWPQMLVSSTTDHSLRSTSGGISYHSSGHAVDMLAAPSYMLRVAEWIKSSGLYRRLAEGIHNPNLSVKYGKMVDPSYWGSAVWGQHINHIHMAIAGAAGNLGKLAPMFKALRTPTVDGGGGIGNVVQGVLSGATAGANSLLSQIYKTAFSGTDDHSGTNIGSGFSGSWTSVMAKIAQQRGWSLSDWRWVVGHESGGIVSNKNPKSTAFGLGQLLRSTYEKYGGGPGSSGVEQIIAMARYMADRYGNPTRAKAFWQDHQYYGKGGFAGFFGRGGVVTADKPTGLVIGDKGRETAVMIPHYATGGYAAGGGGTPKPLGFLSSALGQLSDAGDFAGILAIVGRIIDKVRKLAAKTKSGLGSLDKTLDYLTTDQFNPITLLDDALTTRIARARRAVQKSIYKVAHGVGRRLGVVGSGGTFDDSPLAAFQVDTGILRTEHGGLRGEQSATSGLLAAARRGLRGAKTRGQRKDFRAEIARLLKQQDDIAQKLADNAQAIVERQEQFQQDSLSQINSDADRANGHVDRLRRVLIALGHSGDTTSLIQVQIDSANNQISKLTDLKAQADASGNTELSKQIADQIEELQTSVVELAAQQFQAAIDAVNQNATRRLAANDVLQRFAKLGISQAAAGGPITGTALANLGRIDFAAQGSALQQRGTILTDQRAAISTLLAQAVAAGNSDQVDALTSQLGDLDASVVENIEAIRDNTDAALQDAVSRSEGSSSFLLGLNQTGQSIADSISTLSGSGDTSAKLSLLQQRGQIILGAGQQARAFLIQLLKSVGFDAPGLDTVTGNALVPYLTALFNRVMGSGLLDDAQIQTFEDLITQIAGNEDALLQNTNAINQLSGSLGLQQFSTTAWEMFRDAITNGMGGLLPQYQIPHMASGGTILRSGLLVGHQGEKLIPASVSRSWDGGNTYIDVDITEADHGPDYVGIGNTIAFMQKEAKNT